MSEATLQRQLRGQSRCELSTPRWDQLRVKCKQSSTEKVDERPGTSTRRIPLDSHRCFVERRGGGERAHKKKRERERKDERERGV